MFYPRNRRSRSNGSSHCRHWLLHLLMPYPKTTPHMTKNFDQNNFWSITVATKPRHYHWRRNLPLLVSSWHTFRGHFDFAGNDQVIIFAAHMSRHIFFMFFSFFFRRMLQPFQVENTNLICDEFDWGPGSYQQCADGEGIVSLKPYASFPILLTVSGL